MLAISPPAARTLRTELQRSERDGQRTAAVGRVAGVGVDTIADFRRGEEDSRASTQFLSSDRDGVTELE